MRYWVKEQAYNKEEGNALFLVLIAVALFAALSYAITSSGRGSGTVDKETSMVAAGTVVQYPAGLRAAVNRMLITGTPSQGVTGIDVTNVSGGVNQLFDPAGGGASRQPPNTAAVDAGLTSWTYLDASAAANGFYIVGLGTDVNVSGREVLAVLGGKTTVIGGVTLPICQAILKGFGATNYMTPLGALTAVFDTAAPAATETTAGSANSLALTGATAGQNNANPYYCFSNVVGGGAAPYNYYHALIEG